MDLESWQTASADVKQTVLSQADPLTVRNLCQADRKSREICRDRLPPPVKYRSCLDTSAAAQECDRIPMFSQQQFLRLIPAQMEIYADEPLQLRHEFYSQNYKLPTEGFSEALRKAKIVNTLVALSRPKILLQYANDLPPLPPYIDAGQIDQLLSFYQREFAQYEEDANESNSLKIMMGARSSSMYSVVSIDLWMYPRSTNVNFALTITSDARDTEKLNKINDIYVTEYFRSAQYPLAGATGAKIIYKNVNGVSAAPNPFVLSRVIYDLMNKSFDEWRIEYSYVGEISPRVEI